MCTKRIHNKLHSAIRALQLHVIRLADQPSQTATYRQKEETVTKQLWLLEVQCAGAHGAPLAPDNASVRILADPGGAFATLY
jgi:TfoX/Sxy family transcriptional regulator of competence genes